jgi:tryptophan synthase alpha chain
MSLTMKSHIAQSLASLEAQGRSPIVLMTHLVVGYPSLEDNWKVLEQFQAAGVELVEFQFPFSEPVADGPLFAQANQTALENGTKIQDCFELIQNASQAFDFQILMMGYYNTVFKMGEAAFCAKLAEVGAKGMIVADIPLEESTLLRTEAAKHQLEFVNLVTPTTTDARLAKIGEAANATNGMTYVVARKGTTGKSTAFDQELDAYLARVRAAIQVPLGLGFGISSREDVDRIVSKVDVAILGTQVLRVYESQGPEAVGSFLKGLR